MPKEIEVSGGATKPETIPTSAARLWADILFKKRKEITQVILAYYYPKTTTKDEVRRWDVDDLEQAGYLTDGDIPSPRKESEFSYYPLLCSISCLVGTREAEPLLPMEKAKNQPLDLTLENPRAMILLDFAAELRDKNQEVITNALEGSFGDWYLLRSQRSYHAIFDQPIRLTALPSAWGEMVERCSQASPSAQVAEWGAEIGRSLKTNGVTSAGLEMSTLVLMDNIFRKIRDCGWTFEQLSQLTILDWGHIYYGVKNLIKYYKGLSAGAGYLRIGGKNDGPPPVVVAKGTGPITSTVDVSDEYFTGQPSLF